jgi:hypothetical protein
MKLTQYESKENEKMNEGYQKPSIEMLVEYLSKIPFGSIRPTEMETLLFYVLAYKEEVLEASDFQLAQKYLITETKAARLKVDIAKRFRTVTAEKLVEQFAVKVFEERSVQLEIEGKEKINIPIYDAIYLRAFKQVLTENQLPYETGNNGNLIKLTVTNFIAVFAKCYPGISSEIKKVVNAHLEAQEDKDALFKQQIPLTKTVKDTLVEHGPAIIAAIPVLKDWAPLVLAVGTAAKDYITAKTQKASALAVSNA